MAKGHDFKKKKKKERGFNSLGIYSSYQPLVARCQGFLWEYLSQLKYCSSVVQYSAGISYHLWAPNECMGYVDKHYRHKAKVMIFDYEGKKRESSHIQKITSLSSTVLNELTKENN